MRAEAERERKELRRTRRMCEHPRSLTERCREGLTLMSYPLWVVRTLPLDRSSWLKERLDEGEEGCPHSFSHFL